MAGSGPAAKDSGARRRSLPPARGEWLDLPPVKHEIPKLPPRGRARGRWSARTKRAWNRWWTDRASTQWSEADLDLVEHLADVHEEFVRAPKASLAAEDRQLRDLLGLSPKGKQDRRWRVPPTAPEVEAEPAGVTALDDYRRQLAG